MIKIKRKHNILSNLIIVKEQINGGTASHLYDLKMGFTDVT